MKLNLQAKYSLIILSLVLFVVLVLTTIVSLQTGSAMKELTYKTSETMEEGLLDQLKRRAELLVLFLSEHLESRLYENDEEAIYQTLKIARDQNDVSYVYVYDALGRIIHDGTAKNSLLGQILQDEVSKKAAAAKRLRFQITGNELDVAVPIKRSGEIVGGVRVGFSLKGVVTDIEKMRTGVHKVDARVMQKRMVAIAVLTTLLSLLSIVLAAMVARHLTRPIGALSAITGRIARGEYDVEIPIKRSDEIGHLASAFQNMAQDLKSVMQQEMKRSNELLAAKINLEEIVKRLNQTNKELAKEIEERKRLEAIVLQTEKMAAVGQLAAGVAHEINNPLAVILGYSQLLAMNLGPGDPIENEVRSIEREAMRCRDLVRDLLVFSREGKTAKEKVSLNEMVDGALSLVMAQGRVRDVEVIKLLDAATPNIFANRSQIQQVIVNLCSNAFDAMPHGGRLFIRTKRFERQGEDFIRINVQDTGCGIPEEIRSKIFNPFFTTKGPGKGTGLGLSLVYEIVQKYGGTVDVESEVGKGTTFSIALPVAAKEEVSRENHGVPAGNRPVLVKQAV